VPVNIAYNYFITRIDKLILQMEEGTASVLNLVWRMGHDRGLAAAIAPAPAGGRGGIAGASTTGASRGGHGALQEEVAGERRDPDGVDAGHRLPAAHLLPGDAGVRRGEGALDRAARATVRDRGLAEERPPPGGPAGWP